MKLIKPTIKEVAQEAGVSIATVSRVLNEKDRVKSSTRQKVEEMIHKLNFQPDQNARNMIKKETKTIGIIIPELSNEYWSQLVDVLQDNFWKMGYMLIVGSIDRSLEKEQAFVKSFIERRVDGIIFGSSLTPRSNTDNHIFNLVKQYGIPIVSLDPAFREMNCVLGDHVQGASDGAEHLIRLGHRKIAFIGGPTAPDSRELGFRNAFMLNRLIVDESLIRRSDSSATFQFGYQTTIDMISGGSIFTAIFCYNDATAFGALKALAEKGVRVPEDIAIVGYDDVQMASLFKPALTTVRQPIHEVGEALAKLLIDTIEAGSNGVREVPPKNISFKMQLIVRESCGSQLEN
jgi:LacI family transcriptional regulator